MPTLNEVWEQALQINANLKVLQSQVGSLDECCQRGNTLAENTNTWLEATFDVLTGGVTNLSELLVGVQRRQDVTNDLLDHQVAQQQTMICLLEGLGRNLCDLVNVGEEQRRLQATMAADVETIRHMGQTAAPEAALARQRAVESREAVEACCPPEPLPPRCAFEPCESPGAVDIPRLEGGVVYEPPERPRLEGPHG